jgi:hypothetical protein
LDLLPSVGGRCAPRYMEFAGAGYLIVRHVGGSAGVGGFPLQVPAALLPLGAEVIDRLAMAPGVVVREVHALALTGARMASTGKPFSWQARASRSRSAVRVVLFQVKGFL